MQICLYEWEANHLTIALLLTEDTKYLVFRIEYDGLAYVGWLEIIPLDFDNFQWKNFASFQT